jgi:hypothetical protein
MVGLVAVDILFTFVKNQSFQGFTIFFNLIHFIFLMMTGEKIIQTLQTISKKLDEKFLEASKYQWYKTLESLGPTNITQLKEFFRKSIEEHLYKVKVKNKQEMIRDLETSLPFDYDIAVFIFDQIWIEPPKWTYYSIPGEINQVKLNIFMMVSLLNLIALIIILIAQVS